MKIVGLNFQKALNVKNRDNGVRALQIMMNVGLTYFQNLTQVAQIPITDLIFHIIKQKKENIFVRFL